MWQGCGFSTTIMYVPYYRLPCCRFDELPSSAERINQTHQLLSIHDGVESDELAVRALHLLPADGRQKPEALRVDGRLSCCHYSVQHLVQLPRVLNELIRKGDLITTSCGGRGKGGGGGGMRGEGEGGGVRGREGEGMRGRDEWDT